MDRYGIVAAVLLLFLIVGDVSNADLAPTNSTAIPVSPSQIPNKKSDLKPNNNATVVDPKVNPAPQNLTKDSNNTVIPPPKNNSDTVRSKNSNNSTDTVKNDDGKNINGTKKKEETEDNTNTNTSPVLAIGPNCVASPCRDHKALVACIGSYETGSKELPVLVQNGGEETLEVSLSVSSSDKNPLKELKIPQHHTERINISLEAGRNTKLILNAGHGECVLLVNPSVSEETFFLHLPSYDKLVTPINGAYFLILISIVFGGTWACCKFRKRRRQGGVPYQELEMGLPESVLATEVETAEGWDEGWDDDWDEDNAVKSPGGRHVGRVSANGLTSRSSNRDGWENDWDA